MAPGRHAEQEVAQEDDAISSPIPGCAPTMLVTRSGISSIYISLCLSLFLSLSLSLSIYIYTDESEGDEYESRGFGIGNLKKDAGCHRLDLHQFRSIA